ncbi:DUF6364 family protein [Nonlabens antarcticus]|uniref:DUF6364 family protein n=1 Tax=Nonlabens antarcticus TaxID=392714 RepID=UPI001891A771|nr:DUF6364 family protein [Nonlabens antarcticus]
MDTKLTLKLDKEIIDLAKEYVKEQGTSLSKFIEDYLRRRVQPKSYDIYEELSPEVKEIALSFKGGKKADENIDYKKSKAEYLLKKYGK